MRILMIEDDRELFRAVGASLSAEGVEADFVTMVTRRMNIFCRTFTMYAAWTGCFLTQTV